MPWNLVLSFLVLSIGNAELMVTLVNRLHSRPFQRRTLKWTRLVHDFSIVLFPCWIITGIWWPARQWIEPLTIESHWSVLPIWVKAYFIVCSAAFSGFVWSVLRYQFSRPPSQQVGYSSRVIDIAEELGTPPVGVGPMSSVLTWPFNECFQMDFTQRTLALPSLPSELDGLRILHLSDLHFLGSLDRPYFERVCEHIRELSFDMAVFTGDLIDDMRLLSWLDTTLATIRAPLGQFAILGNHDWLLEADVVRQALRQAGWTDVASRCEVVTYNGATLAIAGNELPWMGSAPSFANAPVTAFRMALVHSPDNLSWARSEGVHLMLSGHNHGGHIVLPVIGPVYSPSKYGCAYSAGVFSRDPTLLCVSRGVSGRHQLRWRCRPEVGILELRCR